MFNPSNDFVSAIIDEIALEGLDGITLQGLWTRLSDRPNFKCAIDDKSKVYFWNITKKLKDVSIFELPVPRKPLIIFNRYNHVDPELGMVLEPDVYPEDIYPHCPVEDSKKKVKGSCSTYNERINISHVARGLSLSEVNEKWGDKLVLVASQDARNTALMGLSINPSLELTILQYCILERVGRSRYLGEVTQGKISLQVVGEDPKTLFYLRKFLMKHKLIVKQVHHQKAGNQNCTGSLLHLPRFHVERKPKALFLTEKVIEILKTRPNYIAEYDEIRKELGLINSLKKLFKTFDFQRYVKTDLKLPYRVLYPSASVQEWKHKGSDKEKKIRAIQLINPDMDVRELWAKDDEIEEEEDNSLGLLDTSEMLLDTSLLTQAYRVVENAGAEGLSQMELSMKMGVSKLQARTLCRNLMRKGVVSTIMNDVGRQRVCRYIGRKFEKDGKMNTEFMRERQKMLSLVGHKRKKSKQSKHKDEGMKISLSDEENDKPILEDDDDSGLDIKRIKLDTVVSLESTAVEVDKNMEPGTETENTEQKIETQILEDIDKIPGLKDHQFSFTEELLKMNTSSKDTPNITYRILRRANLIIEAVRTHKVIDDLTKLMKHINEEEEKEGYNVKIDKKSLLRLLMKLSKDGHVKLIKIVLKGGSKEKLLSFVCEPDISTDHSTIQSSLEQAKMKFFIVGRVPKIETKEIKELDANLSTESLCKSVDEMKAITITKQKIQSHRFIHDPRIGKKYGFSPKFVRMQIMHQFLFYLIYGYEGNENLDHAETVAQLREKESSITDEVAGEMSKVYVKYVDWKMFIPPLPNHAGWPRGWAIMCDLLLRLPLCIFVKIFNVTYIVPGLEQYLMHPIRRHFLVRHLPSHFRDPLIIARRYIFSIHEVMQRLCYVGLIQFGPQRLKEKDQVFIFLNQKTTLLDTTSSKPGYHQVSDDVEYTEHKYEFHSLNDVDKYWYEMWNFCIHTELGGRMCVTGKDIVLEMLQNKQAMIDAIQPRQPEEASLLDTGQVPGDKRGAAGLDSAFFSHLKRNWNWTNTTTTNSTSVGKTVLTMKPMIEEQRKARLASLKSEPIQFGEIFQKSRAKSTKVSQQHIKKKIPSKSQLKGGAVEKISKVSKKKKVVRHVLPRKIKGVHKPYYDEVDMKALQLMSKLRVEWSVTEDNLLLLCKVASVYLCPEPRKQVITFQIIRDVLHDICPVSHNKTSRACQRRILYMMKNPATAHSVALHLEDVRQDPNIVQQFKNTIENLKSKINNVEELEKQAAERFKILVGVLQSKFNPHSSDIEVQYKVIPETTKEFRKMYSIVYPSTTIKKRGRFQDVKNVVDIYCAIVNAIIHSSLCCVSDKTSYTYQLFQVYQQYPDNLLRSAMAKIRGDQMVSLKKSYVRLKPKTGNYLPVSASPYQLSITYLYQLQTKYQYDIFHESFLMSKNLCSWYDDHSADESSQGLEAFVTNGGTAAALIELFTREQLSFEIEIPEQVIILDPRVSEVDETYARVVQRYRDILRNFKFGKEAATASVLFKKPHMDAMEIDEATPSGSKDPNADADDMDPDDFELDATDDVDDSQCAGSQQTVFARTATRIALYMMREELGDSVMGETQHAHDFFVVNSCKVFCRVKETRLNCFRAGLQDKPNNDSVKISASQKQTVELEECNVHSSEDNTDVSFRTLNESEEESAVICGDSPDKKDEDNSSGVRTSTERGKAKESENVQSQLAEGQYDPDISTSKDNIKQSRPLASLRDIPNKLLPLSAEVKKEVLKQITSDILVSEEPVHMNDVKDLFTLSNASDEDWKAAEDIISLARKKKEIGATMKEIRKRFRKLKCQMSLAEILPLLTKSRILYRSGVITVHYIYHTFMKPWLVHSYKLLRLERERQSLPPEGAVMKLAGPDNIDSSEKPSEKAHERIRAWRRRKLLATAKEVEKAVQTLDLSGSEKIHVAIRPWIRVDGSLNRRVLDRMLGSVLGHSMYSPGISIRDIGEHFTPALQPFQVRELIEILHMLGCVKLSVVKQSCRTTLFSKPTTVEISPADGTEDEAKIVVEPQPDAVLRLGQFIGDKLYARDFLSV